MTETYSARIATSEQARAAMDTFVGPAFGIIRGAYIEKLATLAAQPLNNDARAGIEKLALAVKVLDEVQAQVDQVAQDGKVARDQKAYTDRIQQLPAERRKILGIGL